MKKIILLYIIFLSMFINVGCAETIIKVKKGERIEFTDTYFIEFDGNEINFYDENYGSNVSLNYSTTNNSSLYSQVTLNDLDIVFMGNNNHYVLRLNNIDYRIVIE